MFDKLSRRDLLKSGVTGALLGLGDVGFLSRLSPISAAETKLEPNALRMQPDIEPLVRFIEKTPRDRLLEEVADRIHHGLSYRELLAALLLVGVKNIEPRPSVGFKFHAVLVVNSAHLASLASPAEHRWLPIFWALDYYKSAEAQDVQERGDWTMNWVEESAVPPAHKARKAFIAAMDNWDPAAADVAVAGFARTAGANEIYELMFRYGMRDFRSIGHKAIYVSNSFRTLQCIGWQHAEPVLRSLTYALLSHEGGNPAQRDDAADRPFRNNQQLATTLRDDWQSGTLNNSITNELLGVLRTASSAEACDTLVELIHKGASSQAIWDGLHVSAGELLMRQPGIVALHAVTSTNALHFAYQQSGNDETRRQLLLQNAAFITMFRDAMKGRGSVSDVTIDQLSSATEEFKQTSIEEIFSELKQEPMLAARRLLSNLKRTSAQEWTAQEFMDAARVLVFLKGNDAHDYKFSSAVFEDYRFVSPEWRDVYLASNIFKLQTSNDKDNALVERTRAALNA